jgi:hypothetical protein
MAVKSVMKWPVKAQPMAENISSEENVAAKIEEMANEMKKISV